MACQTKDFRRPWSRSRKMAPRCKGRPPFPCSPSRAARRHLRRLVAARSDPGRRAGGPSAFGSAATRALRRLISRECGEGLTICAATRSGVHRTPLPRADSTPSDHRSQPSCSSTFSFRVCRSSQRRAWRGSTTGMDVRARHWLRSEYFLCRDALYPHCSRLARKQIPSDR